MGMFDYVVCEVPLPDGGRPGEMQSKDFDCSMTTIRISAEGRLLIERYESYTVPKEERPYPNAEPGSWQEVCGIWGKRNRRWEDMHFHGDFNFYGNERVGEPEPVLCNGKWSYERRRVWREYIARFTEGQLTGIRAMGDDAQGIEARQDGDANAAPSSDESPVAEGDAPKPTQGSPNND